MEMVNVVHKYYDKKSLENTRLGLGLNIYVYKDISFCADSGAK